MIKTDCSVLEYSVYADTDHHPGRYVFFLETNKSMTKDKNEEYLDVLQKKLYKANTI